MFTYIHLDPLVILPHIYTYTYSILISVDYTIPLYFHLLFKRFFPLFVFFCSSQLLSSIYSHGYLTSGNPVFQLIFEAVGSRVPRPPPPPTVCCVSPSCTGPPVGGGWGGGGRPHPARDRTYITFYHLLYLYRILPPGHP